MGLAKRELERLESQIFSVQEDKHVCSRCLTDEYLQLSLAPHCVTGTTCSYCGDDTAAPLEELCTLIQDAILARFCDPAEELPYESAEGGYQGEILYGLELMLEIDRWTDDDKLDEEVSECFAGAALCKRDYFSLTHGETLSFGWKSFQQKILHETRFLFFPPGTAEEYAQHDEIPPSSMLDGIGSLLLKHQMISEVNLGTQFFRVRVVDKAESLQTPEELGSIPPERAIYPNRMSAVGISMFYAGFNLDTAVLETYSPAIDSDNKKIVVGTFEAVRDLTLIDFTKSPVIPSYFNVDLVAERHEAIFLYQLIRDFSRPIDRDDRAHMEYVPTQVVTEYVRHRLQFGENSRFDGIIYRSSKSGGSEAVVIFAGPEKCVEAKFGTEQLLQLTNVAEYETSEFGELFN